VPSNSSDQRAAVEVRVRERLEAGQLERGRREIEQAHRLVDAADRDAGPG
jgi:hypothetical protein